MNWFFCVVSQKPFLEWEIERFIKSHPTPKDTMIKPCFYFAYNADENQLVIEKPTEDDLYYKIIIGKGYIAKNTGFAQADISDWKKLLKYEMLPTDIDGQYLCIKIKEDYLEVNNDSLGHFPVYYSKAEGYCVASSNQEYIAMILSKKQWNYSSISSLALLNIPLNREPFLNQIKMLKPASVLKLKTNKVIAGNRDISFLPESNPNTSEYLFSFKKAYELQLDSNDFVSIPFENTFSSRLALSIFCHKAKKTWGLYTNTNISPVKYLDSLILSGLKIHSIPDPDNPEEVIDIYDEYIMTTGLADFPEYFNLGGNFLVKNQEDTNIINFFSPGSEYMFLKKIENHYLKSYQIIKSKNFDEFVKQYAPENNFFRKEFYIFLFKGLRQHFDKTVENLVFTDSKYDEYHYFVSKYIIQYLAPGFRWLNSYRNFYAPGLLYSMICKHLYQRLYHSKSIDMCKDLHLNFAPETKNFPKINENKFDILNPLNKNLQYFPVISNYIGLRLEKSEKIPYYDFDKLLKTFKKAKKNNEKAIKVMLKWYAFEKWRNYLE